MAKEVTQKDRVLEYINRTGSITAYEAIKDLGILQLSARLVELEHEGYSFSKKPETAKKQIWRNCSLHSIWTYGGLSNDSG